MAGIEAEPRGQSCSPQAEPGNKFGLGTSSSAALPACKNIEPVVCPAYSKWLAVAG